MIYNVEHADWFCQEMRDMGRDSHVALSRNTVRNWFFTLNNLNGLRPTVTMFRGEETSLFKVPMKLSDLVVPGKVTVAKENYERDFMSRQYREASSPEVFAPSKQIVDSETGEVITLPYDAEYTPELLDSEEFEKVSRKILRKFKLKEELTTVSSKREEALLSSVYDRVVLEGRVRKVQKSFNPLYVEFYKYEDDEYTFDATKMLKQYIKDNVITATAGSDSKSE